jgi:hypothetical protein
MKCHSASWMKCHWTWQIGSHSPLSR